MVKSNSSLFGSIKKLDGYSRVLTGKPLPKLIGDVIDFFGTDAIDKPQSTISDDPMIGNYITLGADPMWSDSVIRSLYRARVKEVHPDTGTKPDVIKFDKLTTAYQEIMKYRKENPV